MSVEMLISDYLDEVERCLFFFETKFGRRDLIRAWREGFVPVRGELTEGVKYQMHGVGCAVEFPTHEVDFDFASAEEVGFDAWRLLMYAEQFPNKYPEYQGERLIESALLECLQEGLIVHADAPYIGEANRNLYLLRRSREVGVPSSCSR